jgi:hypothetical protein
MHKAFLSLACALICWNFLGGSLPVIRVPNRQAVNEKIEPHFL